MVLWCKNCGALVGLKEPLHDWSTDRTAVCVECAKKNVGPTFAEMRIVIPEPVGKSTPADPKKLE